jgi:hypothetical protein
MWRILEGCMKELELDIVAVGPGTLGLSVKPNYSFSENRIF